jgi:hypothetical protein
MLRAIENISKIGGHGINDFVSVKNQVPERIMNEGKKNLLK